MESKIISLNIQKNRHYKCNILWNEVAQTLRQQHRKLKPPLLKNKLPVKDKMISSNINKYVIKCYLNFVKIVPDRMGSVYVSLG